MLSVITHAAASGAGARRLSSRVSAQLDDEEQRRAELSKPGDPEVSGRAAMPLEANVVALCNQAVGALV
jgi:hypothetical protein